MRSAVFWAITERKLQILTDVSEQPIGPIFEGQEIREGRRKRDFLTPEDGTDKFSRNVGKELPLLAA